MAAGLVALRSGRSVFNNRVLASAAWSKYTLTSTGCETPVKCRFFCTDTEDIKPKFANPNVPNNINFAPGIYKAILIGKVGQPPTAKTLPNGTEVVIFGLGTGGLRNNRRARAGESDEAYAGRSFTQWHRVCIFKPSLVPLAKQITKGMNIYVEGSIETRIFNDPVTGNQKRVREISVRQNGRLYMMGAKPLLASDMEHH